MQERGLLRIELNASTTHKRFRLCAYLLAKTYWRLRNETLGVWRHFAIRNRCRWRGCMAMYKSTGNFSVHACTSVGGQSARNRSSYVCGFLGRKRVLLLLQRLAPRGRQVDSHRLF